MADSVRFLHGITPPSDVADHQRNRILEATTHLLYEVGYANTTVSMIVGRAHVSRRTFYENFDHKEHCYIATFVATVECVAAAVRDAYVAADGWAASAAAAFAELARLVVDHPASMHICLMDIATDEEGEARHDAALGLCRDGLRTIVESAPRGEPVDPVAIELAAGGLQAVVAERLRRENPRAAAAVLPAAVGHLLEPLVGHGASRDVVGRLDTSRRRGAIRRRSTA